MSLTFNKKSLVVEATHASNPLMPPRCLSQIDRGVKQGVRGNCKTWGARAKHSTVCLPMMGMGVLCLLKPKRVWNVCSLLNHILTAYDESLSQRSDSVWLCPPVQSQDLQARYSSITVFSISPDTLGAVLMSAELQAAVQHPEQGTVQVMQVAFYKVC